MADWLIDDCLHRRMTIFGACVFGNQLDQSPYIGFVVPFSVCSRVELNQLSPLVSLTRLTLALSNPPVVGSFFSGVCTDWFFRTLPCRSPEGEKPSTTVTKYTFLYDYQFAAESTLIVTRLYRPSRELLGVMAFVTKVSDRVILGDSNGGIRF